jgi:hypothetical protein
LLAGELQAAQVRSEGDEVLRLKQDLRTTRKTLEFQRQLTQTAKSV